MTCQLGSKVHTSGMSEFKNAAVLVTGATSGIGQAVAVAFGREGACVGVLGRNRAHAEQTAAQVKEAGGESEILVVDLLDEAALRAVIRGFVAAAGGLLAAVNAAGLDLENTITGYSTKDFDAVYGTNVRSLLVCMQEEIAPMRKGGGGGIVNVTSIAARSETPHNALYNSSKAAASMLTRCAAMEEGPHGIRINELAPGPVDTPMLRGYFEQAKAAGIATGPEAISAISPLRKIGQPDNLADASVFLASSRAAYITGACLTADGGFSLGMRVS